MLCYLYEKWKQKGEERGNKGGGGNRVRRWKKDQLQQYAAVQYPNFRCMRDLEYTLIPRPSYLEYNNWWYRSYLVNVATIHMKLTGRLANAINPKAWASCMPRLIVSFTRNLPFFTTNMLPGSSLGLPLTFSKTGLYRCITY